MTEPNPPQSVVPAGVVKCLLHVIVRGRVQGVGFREFTLRRATELALSGWVRNLDDGRSVEIEAYGERGSLERLLESVSQGPRLAHVTAVLPAWRSGPGGELGFEIRW